jgi:kinesin family member 22
VLQDQPVGLLTMAMEQIFLRSQPIGAAVSVSSYQVLQDTRVFDLLEPKDNEVLVLEDADGRTNLKGLSKVLCSTIACMSSILLSMTMFVALRPFNHRFMQVRIKSIQEFADLCCCDTDILKHPAKPSNHLQPRGGHHGFIVYISRFDQDDKECLLAKMNFLDLAGLLFSFMHRNFF